MRRKEEKVMKLEFAYDEEKLNEYESSRFERKKLYDIISVTEITLFGADVVTGIHII